MAILGKLLKHGIKLRKSVEQEYALPFELQKIELRKLLLTARDTAFGRAHYFKTILNGFKDEDQHLYYQYYRSNVPIYDYDSMKVAWWSKSMKGDKNVAWPGRAEYYALSSGTSGAPSKHIPVTKEMLKSMRKTGVRQLLALSEYDIDPKYFETDILIVGGSTDLKFNGNYFEGDLSGITTSQIPIWLQRFYKPGNTIAAVQSWDEKLHEMVLHAKDWNIGVIVGVPAWMQILLEKIIDHYQLNTIHDLWPSLKFFVHGGVAFEPYREGFEKLLNEPIHYMETYLASEGFIAFQDTDRPGVMKMVLNNGIFYEFIPFSADNFDEEGNLKASPDALKIDEVQVHQPYALLLSTNAGTWRYLIGDVIEFTNVRDAEIVITGRTKHFLSVCGEHLSLDNINQAISQTATDFKVHIREFCVCGEQENTLFAHHWYIGVDSELDVESFKVALDNHLKQLNDDYAVERSGALTAIRMTFLPTDTFYEWMKQQGKLGGQYKFPRVLRDDVLASWQAFLADEVLKES